MARRTSIADSHVSGRDRRDPPAPVRPVLTSLLLVLLLWPLVLVIGPTSPALAHAVLLRADPSDGAVLATAPSAVRLEFNEQVRPIGPGLRVFTADGTRVDLGRAPLTGAPTDVDVNVRAQTVLSVALPDGLPDGGYVAAWRVLSEDGHAIAGTLRFTVGDTVPVAVDVAAGFASDDVTPWVRSADRAVRGLTLLGLVVAAGTSLARLLIARTTGQRRLAAAVVGRTATVTLLLVPFALWLQGAVRIGTTDLMAASGALRGSAPLTAAVIRSVGLVLLVLLAARARRTRGDDRATRSDNVSWALASALTLLPLATEGHQRSTARGDLAALLPSLDAIHITGGALWVGAVLLLALVVRSRADAATEVTALASRIHRTAIATVGVLTVAGIAQATLLLDGPSALVSTAYGRTLVAKVALVAAAVGIAGLARRRAGRDGNDWSGARRMLRVELGLLGSAVLLTGALITLPPSGTAGATGAGMFTSSAPLGDGLALDVGVDSSRPGRTELHLYVIEDGALTTRPLDIRAALTSVSDAIGPFLVVPARVEPGHWFAALEPLPPGDWELEITVGLDPFTQRTTTFVVPLR